MLNTNFNQSDRSLGTGILFFSGSRCFQLFEDIDQSTESTLNFRKFRPTTFFRKRSEKKNKKLLGIENYGITGSQVIIYELLNALFLLTLFEVCRVWL